MKPLIPLWLLLAGFCHAAPLIDEPVAELRLKSGKVYAQAQAKSFSPSTVFVKHADGVASVKYEDFPADYETALASKRPAPPTPDQIAAQERRREDAIAREAARLKPVQLIGPAMPLNESNLGLVVVRIIPSTSYAEVEVHNFSERPYELGAQSLIAILASGQKVVGRSWIGINSEGRMTAILDRAQKILINEPKQLSVEFPTTEKITRVEWTHPKS